MGPARLSSFRLYQSEQLSAYADRLIHGFSGKPLTLGGPGFSKEILEQNRATLCQETGLHHAHLAIPGQTHSDNIRTHEQACQTETDGVYITAPNRPALVLVADCVPVMLYHPEDHSAAVVHAGWRGTAQQITAKAVLKFHSPQKLVAVIGPCIGGCCYEVSEEVLEAVAQSIPHISTADYSVVNKNQKPQINLKAINRYQLEAAGVSQIEIMPHCTRCDETLWSHRRGEAGRNGAFMELRPL